MRHRRGTALAGSFRLGELADLGLRHQGDVARHLAEMAQQQAELGRDPGRAPALRVPRHAHRADRWHGAGEGFRDRIGLVAERGEAAGGAAELMCGLAPDHEIIVEGDDRIEPVGGLEPERDRHRMLEAGDIVFIDEIHRMAKTVEEYLYSAMEDFAIDIMIDQGPNARSVRLELPRFTLVGATTRIGLIAAPLRARFGLVNRLRRYLCRIV